MDTITNSSSFIDSPWSYYVIMIAVLTLLFFVQKYAYLIDNKLMNIDNPEKFKEKKPWSLISALFLGLLVFILGVFVPDAISKNSNVWSWFEIVIAIFGLLIIIGLAFESFTLFGAKTGLLRFGIWLILTFGFFYAGLYTGLFLASILAIIIIIYFIFFWKKRLTIK